MPKRAVKWAARKLGYRAEHFKIATQMAVAIVAAMVFVVVDQVYDFLGENVVWIVITVVVAFSPTVGAALNSAGVGLLGSILGAALGLLIIVLVAALAAGFSYEAHPVTMSCWATFLMALVGFGLVLNKERFPKLAYGLNIALLTFPIVAIPGFRVESENILSRLKLSLCAIIGVVITMAAAFVVFPIRASARLRRATARMLERTGGLAFHLLGEFCEEPDEDMRLRGSSDTDKRQHYIDDGLQQKYEPLHREALDLGKELTTMASLIRPAKAEMRYLRWYRRKPPRFTIATYKAVNRMLARSLTALGSLQHSLESGHLRMGLCAQNRALLEELRQDNAAAFTALSGLVLESTPEEYARAKMEALSAATLELQSTLEALPLKAGYNVHVETLAIATKTATNIARQVASIYMELRPEAGAKLHTQLCAGADEASAKGAAQHQNGGPTGERQHPGPKPGGGGDGPGAVALNGSSAPGGHLLEQGAGAAADMGRGDGSEGERTTSASMLAQYRRLHQGRMQRAGSAGAADIEQGAAAAAAQLQQHASVPRPRSAGNMLLEPISEAASGGNGGGGPPPDLALPHPFLHGAHAGWAGHALPGGAPGSYTRSHSLPGPVYIPGSAFSGAPGPSFSPAPSGSSTDSDASGASRLHASPEQAVQHYRQQGSLPQRSTSRGLLPLWRSGSVRAAPVADGAESGVGAGAAHEPGRVTAGTGKRPQAPAGGHWLLSRSSTFKAPDNPWG